MTRALLLTLLVAAGCSEAPASQVCVARHAEAFKNLEPPPPDMTPAELDALTPRGARQAAALRERLPGPRVRVWASPAGRTRQTAEALSGAVTVTEALRPNDGDLSWAERREALARGEDPRPPGGESLADGAARATALLERLELSGGEHAVLVTHGDVAPLILGHLAGTPLLERPRRHGLETGQMRCAPLP